MLHNVTHTNLKIWIKLAKTNTKMTKKVKTTSTIFIRWLMICVYSVCGLFSGVWPNVKGQRRPIWGLHNKFKLNPISKLVMCRNCSTNQRPGNDWNSVEYDQGADHNVFVAKHELHLISGLFALHIHYSTNRRPRKNGNSVVHDQKLFRLGNTHNELLGWVLLMQFELWSPQRELCLSLA